MTRAASPTPAASSTRSSRTRATLRRARKRDEPEADAARALRRATTQQWGLTQRDRDAARQAPADAAVQIIAEIKKASPSKGVLRRDARLPRIARDYTLGGAAGISVLTEPNYFLGSLELAARRPPAASQRDFPGDAPVAAAQRLPRRALRAAAGARVRRRQRPAHRRAAGAGAAEGPAAAGARTWARRPGRGAQRGGGGARRRSRRDALGINNRDLHTFNVDLGVTERIRPLLPADAVVVGESGVHTRADVERLHTAGVRAILVGEAFMTAPDIAAKMAELRHDEAASCCRWPASRAAARAPSRARSAARPAQSSSTRTSSRRRSCAAACRDSSTPAALAYDVFFDLAALDAGAAGTASSSIARVLSGRSVEQWCRASRDDARRRVLHHRVRRAPKTCTLAAQAG